MGHSGLRVIRFHKRYYIFIEGDPWVDCLGLRIIKETPADATKYDQWLAAQRRTAEEWEVLYEDFLSVKPGNEVTTDLPDFMLEQLPSFFAPQEQGHLEWVHTLDLDRELFSVDNKNYFKLEQVPHIERVDTMFGEKFNYGESFFDQLSLLDPVPVEGATDFVIEHTTQSDEFSLKSLTIGEVSSLSVTADVQADSDVV